jgi:alkanesulfonate monooxygenase SsuD/methylene tetrahydromethanopterin reductase-like flavin-dependent oxidoreductase (luciferase family)
MTWGVMEEFMKYAAEMGSGVMIYTPKLRNDFQKRQWPSDLKARERKKSRRKHNITYSIHRRIIIG